MLVIARWLQINTELFTHLQTQTHTYGIYLQTRSHYAHIQRRNRRTEHMHTQWAFYSAESHHSHTVMCSLPYPYLSLNHQTAIWSGQARPNNVLTTTQWTKVLFTHTHKAVLLQYQLHSSTYWSFILDLNLPCCFERCKVHFHLSY